MDIDKLVTSYIGRVVSFVLMPVLLVAATPVVNAVNEVLGVGLTDQQVVEAAIATIVGLALTGYQWLRNRGAQELAAVQTVVTKLHAEGAANVAGHQPPVA